MKLRVILGIALAVGLAAGGFVLGTVLDLPLMETAKEYGPYLREYGPYLAAIRTGDQRLLPRIPEYFTKEITGERRFPLRQPAKDFLADTQAGAVYLGFDVRVRLADAYLVEPKLHHEGRAKVITSPLRVRIWHTTDHHIYGVLQITDANSNGLGELRLPEIAYANVVYQVYESVLTFEQPATAQGFLVWTTFGRGDIIFSKKVPIVFTEPN